MFVLVSLLNLLSYLEIFSLESFISTNMAYTHNEFFLGPTHHHTAIFSFDNGHSRGGPTCAGHMGSTLILLLFVSNIQRKFYFSTDGGPVFSWNMIIPPAEKFLFLFKSRTPVRSSVLLEVWLFSTPFLCRIGQLISWETDRTAVAYLSGLCLMCLFEVNGAWRLVRGGEKQTRKWFRRRVFGYCPYGRLV